MSSKAEIIKSENDFKQMRLGLTHEITWNVRSVNTLSRSSGYTLDSPHFDFHNATWCLRLYPCQYINSTSHIGLKIVRLSSREPHHTLQCHLMLRDGERGVCLKVAEFKEKDTEKGALNFTRAYDNFTGNLRSSIEMTCQLSCYESHDVNASSKCLIQDTKGIGDLPQHFKSVLLSGQNRDVVIKVKDKEFRAHQDILRARSPVLGSMLSHDMIEKNKGIIDIPDCDPDAFEQFLLYVYCGKMETLDTRNMLSVYYIADKYDMAHLKEICREFIKSPRETLTCANVSDVIQLALNHSDTGLLECATEYFKKNIRSVLRTVEWQSFLKQNPTQANELLIKATDSLCD